MTKAQLQRKREHLDYLTAVAQNTKAQYALRRMRRLVTLWGEEADTAERLHGQLNQLPDPLYQRMATCSQITGRELRRCAAMLAKRIPKAPPKHHWVDEKPRRK